LNLEYLDNLFSFCFLRFPSLPSKMHVKESFLGPSERKKLRKMFLRHRKLPGAEMGGGEKGEEDRSSSSSRAAKKAAVAASPSGEAGIVHKTITNMATNVAAFPPVFWNENSNFLQGDIENEGETVKEGDVRTTSQRDDQEKEEEERALLVSVLAKVALYATENLKLNGTLKSGPHAHKDDVGMHLGIFAFYEYQPDQSGKDSKVTAHSDMDYEGRCLSAGLHLDNWMESEDEEPINTPISGGDFTVSKCAHGLDCHQGVNHKLAAMMREGVFAFAEGDPSNGTDGPNKGKPTLEATASAPYNPGDLAMFLPESPHYVTPLLQGRRAILFMWFHCDEFVKVRVMCAKHMCDVYTAWYC
jgi:hypothetical protein